MPFALEVKHDTRHRAWKRLSVIALQADALISDVDAYLAQYAADNQMNPDMVGIRVVEITSDAIGQSKIKGKVVHLRESNAVANTKVPKGDSRNYWAHRAAA